MPNLPASTNQPVNGPRRSRRASALVLVMIIMSVLSVVAASLLLSTTARYHTAYQSASWQEAVVGAEAGVDLAMSELRKRVVQGPALAFTAAANWQAAPGASATPYPSYGHAFPGGATPFPLGSHGGEGNTVLQARVYVDAPGNLAIPPADASSSFFATPDNPNTRDPDGVDRSRWWYRVRALGVAGLAGPPQANLQKLDNRLRRFSFFTDWRTGQSVAAPQTARLVEAVIQPQTNFRNALMADKQIDLSNQDVLIDSYDSSKGYYSTTGTNPNNGHMGNIATNGTLINANLATVNGNAMTNSGTVTQAQNVTGQQSSTFYQELTPLTPAMLNPAWATLADGGTISRSTAYTASASPTSPTVVRLDGINLPKGGNVLKIQAPAGSTPATPSYIKIYVQGNITTAADSYINLDPGVNAVVYFTGNVDLEGYGIINNSFLASHLVLNGIQPPANADGTFPARTVKVATDEDFEGVVYAPNHDVTLALNAVPANGSLTGGPGGTTSPYAGQIASLQGQLTNLNTNIANLQIDYQHHMDDDDQNHKDKNSDQDAQHDLAQIALLNLQATALQAQITALQGAAGPASSADDHARGYNGIYGGFVGRTISVSNKTHIHYDETLRQAGPVNHYDIVNWFEDNLSHDALGGSELFWWPVARN